MEQAETLLRITLPEKIRSQFKLNYLSLIDCNDIENDPIFKQSFPVVKELEISRSDMKDPLHEEKNSLVEGVIHRYPDRALLLVSNMCATYCRHCTKKRRVGDKNTIPDRKQISKGIKYIKKNSSN